MLCRAISPADSRKAALVKVSLAGAVTAIGGVVGYFLVSHLEAWLPLFLVVASSSFIYVALGFRPDSAAAKTPGRAPDGAAQIAWLAVGIALVLLVSSMSHHTHAH